jgi:hypothetical protein
MLFCCLDRESVSSAAVQADDSNAGDVPVRNAAEVMGQANRRRGKLALAGPPE